MTRARRANLLIILILGALSTVSPFSIDMYLPAFPQIARDLGTTPAQISFSVSGYFIGLALGQLSQNLKVSGGNVSGLVQRLLADDLISREMSSEDRRSFIVRLTPKGEALFRKAAAVHKKHLSARLENIPIHELDTALSVLRSLSSKLRSESKKQSRKK